MKILDPTVGPLTNFEVLDLLRSRGAGKDPTRVIASVSQSEFKVFDYLEQTVACNQTREVCEKFAAECKKFDLAKAEILNIVNTRPTNEAEIFPMIEEYEAGRMEGKIEELLQTITELLPPHPSPVEETNQQTADHEEETQIPNNADHEEEAQIPNND